jgi:neutral ceramidase
MKRRLHVLGWIAAVCGLIGVTTAVATLDLIDLRPYLRQPYHAETTRRVQRTLAEAQVVRGELFAGFGRTRLTPTVQAERDEPEHGRFRQVPLAGYGSRQGRPARGVQDELEAKAVLLRVGEQVVALVSLDALIVPPEVAARATARLDVEFGLRREQVYFSATHTHAGPGGWGVGRVAEAFAGPFLPGMREWMATQIVAAVAAAMRDVRPARAGQGRFEAPEFVRNRLVGELGRVDAEFSFLLVEQAGGGRAVLGSFAAHATVLPSALMAFSGDYPGYWQRAVEAATGGMAMFLAGGMGSHSPVPGARGLAGAERMGRQLADRLLTELPRTALAAEAALGVAAVDVVLPEYHLRVTDQIRLRPWVARRLLPADPPALLQAVRLNGVVWVSTPCDFSGELALGIKDFLRQRGGDAVVTSFNGGYIGYVIPARYYHLPGYEPRTMSFHGPNVADYLDDTIRTLALGLIER